MQTLTRYVCLGALLTLCAQSQTEKTLWLASFDQVWQTVRDKHFDAKLNGVDWQAARDELRPKVEGAASAEEARGYIQALLSRLGHSHVGIIPAAAYRGSVGQFGHLPSIPLELKYERLSPASGYIRITAFFDPDAIEGLLKEAATDCHDCRGLILDLRGNPGGIGGLAATVASWFVDRPLSLGTCYFRNAQLNLATNPRSRRFSGKLAILIDGRSMSTSEILAGGMQDLHRATIFGQPSPGFALPSAIEKLPSGDGFQYTTANYISVGGRALEGNGVKPDVLVPLASKTTAQGLDATRAAAQQWIEKE